MNPVNFQTISDILSLFIPQLEGFSSIPYWDKKQWTWGFGTFAGSYDKNNKPKGSITEEDAMREMKQHFINDYTQLVPLVKIELQPFQWAAYLCFAYNEGVGNAKNLLADINSKSEGLEAHWKKYFKVRDDKGELKPSYTLRNRRDIEWKLWCNQD